MQVEGFLILFWAMPATTTPSLAANASGGFCFIFLGNTGYHHPLPCHKHEGRVLIFFSG
jgi:hypothetical protein